jgi:hypothetical protein
MSFFTPSLPLSRLIKDIFQHRCLKLLLVMGNLFLVAVTGFTHTRLVPLGPVSFLRSFPAVEWQIGDPGVKSCHKFPRASIV